jgi:hypothetical protein
MMCLGPMDTVKEGNLMMKRSLLVSALAAALGLVAGGCLPHAEGLVASAPAPVSHLTGRIPATGTYILFRVDSIEPTNGRPTSVTEVASYDLQEGAHVGFEWVPDEKSLNTPDEHMDLIAYAGTVRQNLGPIMLQQQKYYWATKDGFTKYWQDEPGYGFYNKMTLQY